MTVFIAYPDMPLSERLRALRDLDGMPGLDILTERADAAFSQAGQEIEQARMARLTEMSASDLRDRYMRISNFCQMASLLYKIAAEDIGREQRREVRVR
jgi:hypothetical protein